MQSGRIIGSIVITLCAGAIAWSASAAGLAPTAAPQTFTGPLTAGIHHAPFRGVDVTKQRCNDAWFRFLPGHTDYCHGIHEWARGDYDDALFDLKDAASWASKNAQYALGLIYFNGHHVAKNRPLGLAWLLLSAERHKPQHYVDVALSAYRLATPDERRQAVALFKQMRPRYGDRFAAHRAKVHFRRAVNASMRMHNNGDGTTLCITDIFPFCTPTHFALVKLHKAEKTYLKYLPEGRVDVGPVKQVALPGY